jgi:CheY-like chemotaxis protein
MGRRRTIVYIQDNPGDIMLLRQAFEERGYDIEIQVLNDWDQAINYLKIKETRKDAPPPDLILLDQRVPKGEGRDLMAFIRDSDYLRRIPAFLFASHPLTAKLKAEFSPECVVDAPRDWNECLVLSDQLMECMQSGERRRAST